MCGRLTGRFSCVPLGSSEVRFVRSRPAPKRRAEKARAQSRTTSTHPRTSPGARKRAEQPSRRGKRHLTRGNRPALRLPGMPLPALVGATALLVAATGAVTVSPGPPATGSGGRQYLALSESLAGVLPAGRENVSVSRSLNRDLLARQAN